MMDRRIEDSGLHICVDDVRCLLCTNRCFVCTFSTTLIVMN